MMSITCPSVRKGRRSKSLRVAVLTFILCSARSASMSYVSSAVLLSTSTSSVSMA